MPSQQQPYVVLAAIAFDPTGDQALREGMQQARLRDACELHLVHVAPPSSADAASNAAALARIADQLKSRVTELSNVSPFKITAHIRVGTPAPAVLQTAADIDADLIVVGTHKRSSMKKLILGSVAEHVLRDAHCPVLVAMPKDYLLATQAQTIEPACPECVAARFAAADGAYWCERHSHSRLRPHVYEPTDSHRPGPLES
jgi:nucleotide-binding universal stress UspA family protein